MTPAFGITHRATGQWLHIRRFDGEGKVLLTDNPLQAWVSFREQAVSQASFLEVPEDYLVVEMPAFDLVTLIQFSEGKIDRHAAMHRLGIRWYGDLLKLLGAFDLPMYQCPPDEIGRQVDGVRNLLSSSEQTTDSAQSVAAAQEFDRVIDIPGSDVRAGFVFGNPFSERPTEVWLLVDRLDPKAIADLLKPDPTSHDEFRGYISTNANIYVVVGTQVYEIERRGESGFALIPLEDQ